MATLLLLCALLVAAAIIDWRHRRIPNRLVMLGAASAVLSQGLLPVGLHPAAALHAGTPGLAGAALAGVLMLTAAGLLWRLGFWGAGDAKWLTVIAAHAAPALVPVQLLLTAMAGGLLALWWKATGRKDRLPYAVAIAGGEFALMAWLATATPPPS